MYSQQADYRRCDLEARGSTGAAAVKLVERGKNAVGLLSFGVGAELSPTCHLAKTAKRWSTRQFDKTSDFSHSEKLILGVLWRTGPSLLHFSHEEPQEI
jgi:hypothetical protein